MIIFLSGKDTFRSRAQLRKMVEKFRAERDPQGINVVTLDAEAVKPAELWQQVLALPFLAARRMIVIENLLSSKHQDMHAELLARIEEKRLPESNVIVLWEAHDTWKTKSAKALAERLAQEPFAQTFEELQPAKIGHWIVAEVKQRGGSIEKKAVQALTQHIGTDMWQLSSCLDQLLAFAHGREIAEQDVFQFVQPRADENIFTLVDAIVAGNVQQAFAMMREQYRIGKDAQFVFAMILRQFRILIQIRDVFDRQGGMPGPEMAKQLGVHPFVLKKSATAIRQYDMPTLRGIFAELLDIDIKMKSGGGDAELLLDLFVGRRKK